VSDQIAHPYKSVIKDLENLYSREYQYLNIWLQHQEETADMVVEALQWSEIHLPSHAICLKMWKFSAVEET
jgi:hypothetical protein